MPPEPGNEPADATLLRMIRGYRITQLVYVVSKLGIPDRVARSPKDARTLASEVGAHPDRLLRVLRMLAALGVFTRDAEARFGLTPIGELLVQGADGAFAGGAIFAGEAVYRAWGDLLHTVRTGETAFDHLYGMGHFEYLGQNPEAAATFHQIMAASVGLVGPPLVGYDLSRHRVLVDVGGGNGSLVASVVREHPHLRGILFDRPDALVEAPAVLASVGVSDRVEIRPGSMFDSVPSGGDVYVLSRILHDWPDDRALIILKNCRRAMPAGGVLLLVDGVLPREDPAPSLLMVDLQMMVMTGGRERSEDEWAALLEKAGFELRSVRPSRPNQDLVVARAQ